MNALRNIPKHTLRSITLLALAVVLAGCATPGIDWSSRVGNYTYDQAVIELGPPDKQATLENGTTVAEWLTRRAYTHVYPTLGYGHPWFYSAYPMYAESYSPNYYLRLIFGPDGQLQASKQFSR